MNYFRINIYLNFKTFLKSIISKVVKRRGIETLIQKNSKKRYFILTSQLRVGFLILLKYLKKKYPTKNEIIFQPFNLPEMINIAIQSKFKVRFKKLNYETGQPDFKYLNSIVNNKTLALVATNIFLSPKSIIFLKNFCKKKKIIFIEDNAIYFDNFFFKQNKKKYSGSFGDYTLYSFNIMKNVSSFFGGGVATDDIDFKVFAKHEISNYREFFKFVLLKQIIIFFILKVLKFRFFYQLFLKIITISHQKNNKFILKIVYPSLKFKKTKFPKYYFTKISSISKNATFYQLKNLNSRKKNHLIRKKNNIFYSKLFKKLNIKQVKILPIENYNFQNFMDFPIFVENREKLNNYLLINGIETKYIFYQDCVKIFKPTSKKEIKDNSEYFSNKVIGLPNHVNISKDYMNRIGERIKRYYDSAY